MLLCKCRSSDKPTKIISKLIDLKTNLKKTEHIEKAIANFYSILLEAAKPATPVISKSNC